MLKVTSTLSRLHCKPRVFDWAPSLAYIAAVLGVREGGGDYLSLIGMFRRIGPIVLI